MAPQMAQVKFNLLDALIECHFLYLESHLLFSVKGHTMWIIFINTKSVQNERSNGHWHLLGLLHLCSHMVVQTQFMGVDILET